MTTPSSSIKQIPLGTGPDTPGSVSLHAAYTLINQNAAAIGGSLDDMAAKVPAEAINRSAMNIDRKWRVKGAGDPAGDDTPALNAAIQAMKAAGGGMVEMDGDFYLRTGSAVIPECHNLGAEAGLGTAQAMVNLVGQSSQGTRLIAPVDRGAGTFALSCGDPTATKANEKGRYSGTNRYQGLCADFSLVGPGTNYTMGGNVANMHGMAWGALRQMERVHAHGFGAGFNIVGDHTSWRECHSFRNTYGAYYPPASAYMYGDLLFQRCYWDGNMQACFFVSKDAMVVGSTFVACRFGGAPRSFYAEAGAGPNGYQHILAGCQFLGGSAEYQGHETIYDANYDGTDAGTLQRGIINTIFDGFFLGRSLSGGVGDATVSGWSRYAPIVAKRLADVKFRHISEQDTNAIGTQAYFICREIHNVELDGGIEFLADIAHAAGKPIITGPDLFAITGFRFKTGSEEGCFVCCTEGDVIQGDILEPYGYGTQKGQANSLPVAGIAKGWASGGFSLIPMTQRASIAFVNHNSPPANAMIYKGANGKAVSASGTTPVGFAIFQDGGTQARTMLR